jgi:hypothetical protein
VTLGGLETQVSLPFNRSNGRANDGSTFTGGLDGVGGAYSSTLLVSSAVVNNTLYSVGPANGADVISCAGQVVTLPSGTFSSLRMLATGVEGNQASQNFVVTYTDNSTTTFTQSLSDWFTPQGFSGETAKPMSYRDNGDGSRDNRTFNIYTYSFGLNTARTVKSVTLPNNANVEVLALTLVK